MAVKGKDSTASSFWAKVLDRLMPLIILLGFVTFILWIVAGFMPRPTASPIPAVVDTAGVFSENTVKLLTSVRFPKDTPVLIRTVNKIPMREIGTYATDAMNSDPHWQLLRPRGRLRRFLRHDTPSGTGVFVLVSMDPLLLQIRYGDQLRLGTYRTGLAAGPWYLQQQRFPEQIEAHTVEVVRALAQKLGHIRRPSWLMGLLDGAGSEVYAEIEDALAPPDNHSLRMVFRAYVSLLAFFGGTRSILGFAAVSIFFVLVPWFVLKELVLWPLKRAEVNKAVINVIHSFANLALVGIAAMSVVCLGLLSHGRIEDEMALSTLGLGLLGHHGFAGQAYARSGGLLIAIPAAILKFIVDMIQDPPQKNRVELKLGCLLWGGVLLILPLAIGAYAIPILIWQLGKGIVGIATDTDGPDSEAGKDNAAIDGGD